MKDKKEIEYTTSNEQIALLKSKGLSFGDEANAKVLLEEYGYYNIINSYKTPYIKTTNRKKEYISGTTFEQIYSLFTFDHMLRNSVMAAMLDFEEHLRAAAAEVIASSFGTDHKEYLQWRNYRDRYVTKPRFSLRGILGTLQQNINSGKDPIRYYREKYDAVPPWILFKGTYFSTLVNFVRLFKDTQKQALIQKLYSVTPEISSLPCMKQLFSDTLFLCLDYRNRAAHGGRIYNFTPKSTHDIVNNTELFELLPHLKPLTDYHGISQLIILMSLFSYETPANMIDDSLKAETNRHLHLYPQDKKYLEDIIGFELIEQDIVWTTPNGHKYHSHPTCSGIKDPVAVPFNELNPSIYTPCKRCIKNE